MIAVARRSAPIGGSGARDYSSPAMTVCHEAGPQSFMFDWLSSGFRKPAMVGLIAAVGDVPRSDAATRAALSGYSLDHTGAAAVPGAVWLRSVHRVRVPELAQRL
jgi:hypothetical protein